MSKPLLTRMASSFRAPLIAVCALASMAGAQANELYVEPTGVGIGLATPERLLHLRGPNAAFRIDRPTNGPGFLLVRTDASNNAWKSYFAGVTASAAGNGQFVINDLNTATTGGGVTRMTITNAGETHFSGVVRAPAFVATSSARFKDNIRPLDHSLQAVQRLQGVKFEWKDGGATSVGFVAEEVRKIFPELVAMDGEQAAGVNYSALVAVLLEALKEQQQQMDAQQTQLQAMQARVEAAEQATLLKVGTRLQALEERLQRLSPSPLLQAGAEGSWPTQRLQ